MNATKLAEDVLIYSILQQIDAATNQEEVKSALAAFLPTLGVTHFAIVEIAGIPSGPPHLLNNYPRAWGERYLKYRYEFADPIARAMTSGIMVDRWAKLRSSLNRATKGWKILHEAKEFGLGDGWAIPLPSSDGSLVVATYAGARVDDDPKIKLMLRILSMFVNAKLTYLRERPADNNVRLTAREIDALRYAAYGRNDAEISALLGISEATVHMHIENAKRKLGVQKRIAAVVEAIRRRLVML
jgi:LuxR family transcriptional regulator, quorum-sensing system regulator BjaR1